MGGNSIFKLAMGSLIIVLGITLILLGIYNTQKKILEMNIQDKNVLNKYLKHQKVSTVITGFSFLLLGILSILNLLTGEQSGLLGSSIYLLSKVTDFAFEKKYPITTL